MNSKAISKLLVGYAGIMSAYGFYRGYNNLFDKNAILHYDPETTVLVTDKVLNGMAASLYQIYPPTHILSLVAIIRRSEKKLKGMPIENDDYRW